MSAIIAGQSCKRCNSNYWLSMGHHKWYDDVVKRNKKPTEIYKTFREAQASGLCPNCWLSEVIEKHKHRPDELSNGFVPILLDILESFLEGKSSNV